MATVIVLDPVASAMESFLLHVRNTFPGTVNTARGIRELGNFQKGDEIQQSIEMIAREIEYISPTSVDIGTQGAQVDVQWKVAQLRFTAQFDLWTPSRVFQDISGPDVEDLFYNRLPHQGGLHILSNWYHDRPIIVTAGAGVDVRDSNAVVEGSWQKRWELSFLTDLIVISKLPKATEIRISLSTELGPDIVAEPDLIIT